MNKKYSIIGGGLSGLTVACALFDSGIDNFAIFDIKTPEEIQKTKIKGLVYLHENPMMLDIPKQELSNFVYGDAEESLTVEQAEIRYRQKIGLEGFISTSSLATLKSTSEFYDAKKYKNILIEKVKDKYFHLNAKIDDKILKAISENSIKTFYTIPITEILSGDFKSLLIFGKEELPPEFIREKFSRDLEDYVIYNISSKQSWYRSSFINGRAWLESTDANFGTCIGQKIVDNPTALEFWKKQTLFSNTIPVGRYALWSRTILLHHVYNSVKLAIYGGEIIE